MFEKILTFILDPAIVAGIVAIFTITLNKRKDISVQVRNIKEQRYITFLSALISLKAGDQSAKKELNETVQIINLIGSTDVVQKSNEFLQMLLRPEKLTVDEQNTRYSLLVQAMREDLYGKRSTWKFPEKLGLMLFVD